LLWLNILFGGGGGGGRHSHLRRSQTARQCSLCIHTQNNDNHNRNKTHGGFRGDLGLPFACGGGGGVLPLELPGGICITGSRALSTSAGTLSQKKTADRRILSKFCHVQGFSFLLQKKQWIPIVYSAKKRVNFIVK